MLTQSLLTDKWGFLRLSAGHNGDSWLLSLIAKRYSWKWNCLNTICSLEERYQKFLSFLHIRSLEVCFCTSVSIRACESINLCNALTGMLDWGWTHSWECCGSSRVCTAAGKKLPHFSLKKQCLSAEMARIYLFGFMKSKDHMPIYCPWSLEYWSLSSLNEWQKLYIIPKPGIHANSKL